MPRCGQHSDDTRSLLQVLLPSATAALSALCVLYLLVRRMSRRRRDRAYQALPTHRQSFDQGEETDSDSDEFAEHLSLRHTLSRQTADVQIKFDRPPAERTAVTIEVLCVIGIIATQLALFTSISDSRDWPSIFPVLAWTYTLGLVVTRFIYSDEGETDLSFLWNHTALVYLFNLIYLASPFRSTFIHPSSGVKDTLSIVRYALVCLLCAITVSVRKGNSIVVQDIVNGLEPSHEPVASLFSLASFSWLDKMIWQGYWTPLSISDVWNLRNDDVAVSVLFTFRQTK